MTRSSWERRSIVGLLLLVAVLVVWGFSCAPRVETARTTGDAGRLAPGGLEGALVVDGQVGAPLAPGRSGHLDVRIANRHDEPLEVRRVVVAVSQVDAPRAGGLLRCGAEDFDVVQGDLAGLVVGTGETLSLSDSDVGRDRWPRLRMVAAEDNQDGCKDASLELAFEAHAVPA